MRPRHLLNPSYQSKWGSLWNLFIPNQMATLITDKNRNLHILKSDFLPDYRDCKFYSLPWATTESLQLLFDNFSTPLTVETNQEFQIWFSEDLFKRGYGDNGYEKTCCSVWFVYGDPESETKDLRRENVCCGGTRTMKLDPTSSSSIKSFKDI